MIIYFQPALGPDGKIKEPESNVLLAAIENMQYAVTVDVLYTVRDFFYPTVIHLLKYEIIFTRTFVQFRYSQHLVLSRRLQYLRRMVELRL